MAKKSKAAKTQTAVRFDQNTLERLDSLRARTGLSVGFLIRQSVEAALPDLESGRFLKLAK